MVLEISVPLIRFLLSVSLVMVAARAAPIQTTTKAEKYLSQFGYLPATSRNSANGGLLDSGTWSKAIMDFQRFGGINATGELDTETMELMSLPRCGVRDKVSFSSDSRAKRHLLQGSLWNIKALTYRISKYPKKLIRAEVDAEVLRAFNVWSRHTDLSFTPRKTNRVDIEIRFEEGRHGDAEAFDGAGGTLGHAYFPIFGGDVHFDDAENWTIGNSRGTNLFQVAAHEFGHSLGLSHSDVPSALMAPFYQGYDPFFRLDSDDIQGIQTLYGKKTIFHDYNPWPVSEQLVTSSTDNDEICKDPKIDAIFNTHDGGTYAFKGNYYYKLTENAIEHGYPKVIAEGWPGLTGNIDAAFTYKNGKTYFFKGSKYWRYSGRQMDGDYPKEISDVFTGIPDNLDAALVWGGNGQIYFYKGTKFWRFDPLKRSPVKSTYAKPLSNWEGVPNNIDAALQYTNGYTYFFKGDKYYRFNDRTFSVDEAFPRPTAQWWYGCQNVPSAFDALGNVVSAEPLSDHSGSDVGDLIFDGGQWNRPEWNVL